jgi:putative hydrolase of the HAD superfamily
MIEAVVFDLDDTLYDEIDYCRSGFRSVSQFLAKSGGILCPTDVFDCLWRHFSQGNRDRTFNAAMDELGVQFDKRLIAQLVQVYRSHRPDIQLPPESARTLEALKATYTLALLTDGFLPAQRLKVQALGLEPCFSTMVFTEELGRSCWKPSPAGFEWLVEHLGIPANRMVYVADNESKDFIAPNRLGMYTIQIARPNGLHKAPCRLPDAPAKLRIARLSELEPLLRGLACGNA